MLDAEFQLAVTKLRECILTRDDDEVENVLMELDSLTLEVERWPDGFFEALEELMQDQKFLSLGKSWNLFYFINGNWEQISETQKDRLRSGGPGFRSGNDPIGESTPANDPVHSPRRAGPSLATATRPAGWRCFLEASIRGRLAQRGWVF